MHGEWTQCLNQERYPEVSDVPTLLPYKDRSSFCKDADDTDRIHQQNDHNN